jgi:cyclic pyranopterin phosphate synthase
MRGMVDVGDKPVVRRAATARGHLRLTEASREALSSGTVRKGDAYEVARAAALLAAKATATAIPHCHPVPLNTVKVDFSLDDEGLTCTCRVEADYRTGMEMEALHATAIALLTVWDMVKYLEKDEAGQYPETRIEGLSVVEKVKG